MTNGYAPGDYTIRCHKCGKHKTGMDKRAITCKECADTMKTMFIIHPPGRTPLIAYPAGDLEESIRAQRRYHVGATIYVVQAEDIPDAGSATVVTAEECLWKLTTKVK